MLLKGQHILIILSSDGAILNKAFKYKKKGKKEQIAILKGFLSTFQSRKSVVAHMAVCYVLVSFVLRNVKAAHRSSCLWKDWMRQQCRWVGGHCACGPGSTEPSLMQSGRSAGKNVKKDGISRCYRDCNTVLSINLNNGNLQTTDLK